MHCIASARQPSVNCPTRIWQRKSLDRRICIDDSGTCRVAACGTRRTDTLVGRCDPCLQSERESSNLFSSRGHC
jgi:hypothetical protein